MRDVFHLNSACLTTRGKFKKSTNFVESQLSTTRSVLIAISVDYLAFNQNTSSEFPPKSYHRVPIGFPRLASVLPLSGPEVTHANLYFLSLSLGAPDRFLSLDVLV